MTPPDIDILIEDGAWDAAALPSLAVSAVALALTAAGLTPGDWSVSFLFCDDARIADLNAEFRGKPTPTNVLSWPAQALTPATPGARPPAPDPVDPELGDIALARETVLREAAEAGIPLEHHLTHLILHGTLHLLGFDHETDEDAALMEALEIQALAQQGVANPYQTG